ncbi:major facilitator superfamily domain-containing protein [Pyronema omphalodes]|nr:major facilitator superfamily domain-containing protein [Pyronema omphalodes]
METKDQDLMHLENGMEKNLASLDAQDLQGELDSLDREMEAVMRKKYDYTILPVVTLIYLMAFIDRSNMGNAKIMGMEEDLHLKGYDFNIALTGFFVTYVLFEVPANVLCKHFGPRVWLSLITFLFGIITLCIAFVDNKKSLIAARVCLGVAEAGIMPGITYTLSTFYRRHELVTRVGTYASVASVAGGFGGLLATGFSQIPQWGMVHSWRNIFFFEGVMTIVAAVICYCALPNSPGEARFLSKEEKQLGVRRIQLEALALATEKMQKRHFTAAILNLNTWLMSIGLFCSLLCMNSVALFMPSLLRAMHFTSIKAQLMTVPPYVLGSIVCISAAITSDRFKTRGTVLLCLACPTIVIGFALLLSVNIIAVKYFALFLVTMGAFTGSPVFISWTVDNSAGPTVRAIASGFAVSLGSTGGLVATWTYLPSEAPGYTTGHIINLCAGIVFFLVTAITTTYLRWENRMRDQGKRDYRVEGKTEEEIATLGHSHPAFRYTP